MKCDLCSDSNGEPETLYLHARCHITAPLTAEIEEDILTLRCYVPECGRTVARFRVLETAP